MVTHNDHGFMPGPKRKVTNLGKAGRAAAGSGISELNVWPRCRSSPGIKPMLAAVILLGRTSYYNQDWCQVVMRLDN